MTRAMTRCLVEAALAANGPVWASGAFQGNPTDVIVRTSASLLVSRVDFDRAHWQALCVETSDGAIDFPLAALEPWGVPIANWPRVLESYGVNNIDGPNAEFVGGITVDYVAVTFPPTGAEGVGELNFRRVNVTARSVNGRISPEGTMRVSAPSTDEENVREPQDATPVHLAVRPGGHCELPRDLGIKP
jgi:hypothetical protein